MIRVAVIFLALALGVHAAELFASVSPQPGRELRTSTGDRSSGTTVNAARLADQIRKVEDWNGRDGAHHERGPYQITRDVWRQHMPAEPFILARQEDWGRACALKHIAWLGQQLRRAGWPDNVHTIALAYNAGLTAVLRGKAPMDSYDYALRVERLYNLRN